MERRLLEALLPCGEAKDREALRAAFGWKPESFRVELSRLRSHGPRLGFRIDGRESLVLHRAERVAWRGCKAQDCGTCRSCVIRARWRSGAMDNVRPWQRRRDRWSAEEIERLRGLAGTLGREEIAAQLSREFGTERTGRAVRTLAHTLGISLALRNAWTARDVAALFGVEPPTVTDRWIAQGLLSATQARRGGHWRIRERDLEHFVRRCGWEYDWQRMQPGRLRQLAEVVNRSDPWLPLGDAAHALGYSRVSLIRFRRAGLVEGRVRRGQGHGGLGYVIRRADLPRVAERLAARYRAVAV